ncbi:hypothetical protein [Oceanicoccus sagamiensis]|uniref:GIY-YIG domain-containing protein n=1 Tax=Oceanicoccus sagamiensis TaxID=716816 RepID=A0A1X9NBG7_9GAMM|nr:hypothetical protein [Oceanicoccus sagamiensis]ARN73782.1 hypothetical protein BST96_06445 [Oceanicoccus sagamiensis]
MKLQWGICGDDKHWCDFHHLNLDSDTFKDNKGVYIIWSGETVVRLGSGIIKDRISEHRGNSEINTYNNLKVTWATVKANQMEGVERYLADVLDPAVGDRFPDATPIEVNLPW